MTALQIPAALDTGAAEPLRAELLARLDRNEPLMLDGAEVSRAGLACMQVLASAREEAGRRGVAYSLDNASEGLRQMADLARLGFVLDPIA